MITLSPTSALMAYLCLTLGALLTIWAFSHLKVKRRDIITSEKELLVCEYCQSAYLALAEKTVTQCPDCKSFNKNNRFKTRV